MIFLSVMLIRESYSKWKKNTRQWDYVQWKFNILNIKAEVGWKKTCITINLSINFLHIIIATAL